MNIVVEGPDGTGKSTLCRFLSVALGRIVINGEGPSKGPGELDQRIVRMMHYQNVIFDRHPAVSGPIYQAFKGLDADTPSMPQLVAFYGVPHLFVYAHPTMLTYHEEGNPSVDTKEYLEWLRENELRINSSYEVWALTRAHFMYRAGDNLQQLANAIKGAL